jgi:hypothetical protein
VFRVGFQVFRVGFRVGFRVFRVGFRVFRVVFRVGFRLLQTPVCTCNASRIKMKL